MGYFLGIDVGTTGVKALAMDEHGATVGECTRSYATTSPHTNWFEQDPCDWWTQTCAAVRDMVSVSRIVPSDVLAIGLSGQYHGLVAVDGTGGVVRPAILWNDQRTAAQAEDIVRRAGREMLLRVAGTRGALYFTACKLLWVRENEPEAYKRIRKILLPKDYVRFRMTGKHATDVTDASGTMLLDLRKREWSSDMCRALDIEIDLLPEVYESACTSGHLCDEAARQLALPSGIPVTAGGGDQACAAIGNGIVSEGSLTCSLGTSGVIYACTDSIKVDQGGRVDTFCHAVPGKWALLAVINSAAASLDWFQARLCRWEREEAGQRGKSVYALLDEQAQGVPAGSERLVFLPYLAGERHPHGDPLARGVFLGLHSGHTLPHLARAVMEGVAYSFRDCLDVLNELGVPARDLRATGGGTKSSLWMSILSSVMGESLSLPGQDEGGAARGAAILSAVSIKAFSSVESACHRLIRFERKVNPSIDDVATYSRFFGVYRSLYALLKEKFAELASL